MSGVAAALFAALLAIYGVIVGNVLGGSFAVEIVTSWPGWAR
jgi:hypothetical protein